MTYDPYQGWGIGVAMMVSAFVAGLLVGGAVVGWLL